MRTAEENQLNYRVEFPGLPLAVYRELAAHLRQVKGVETDLMPQSSQEFDYSQSQVGSLSIKYCQAADLSSRQLVDRILEYYQQRYGKKLVISH